MRTLSPNERAVLLALAGDEGGATPAELALAHHVATAAVAAHALAGLFTLGLVARRPANEPGTVRYFATKPGEAAARLVVAGQREEG